MLQKNRSARIKLVKYCLSAPLFVLMLILSAATVNTSNAVTRVNILAGKVLGLPASKITAIRLLPPPDTASNVTIDAPKKIATTSYHVDSLIKTEIVVTQAEAEKLRAQKATDTVPEADPKQVFNAVEQQPRYPGNFGDFLAKNIHYPEADKNNNVQGKVFIQFIVEKDGTIDNFKVLRAPSTTLGEEAVRVLSLSPKWIAGTQNGKLVRVMYTVPISFTLSQDDDKNLPRMLNNVDVVGYGKADSAKANKDKNWSNLAGPSATEALIIIDGKQRSYDDMKALDVNTIKSIHVYNSKTATSMYGSKGKNGVIVVSTKK